MQFTKLSSIPLEVQIKVIHPDCHCFDKGSCPIYFCHQRVAGDRSEYMSGGTVDECDAVGDFLNCVNKVFGRGGIATSGTTCLLGLVTRRSTDMLA